MAHTLIESVRVEFRSHKNILGCVPSQRTFLARQSSHATAIFRRFALGRDSEVESMTIAI
jgi:hypothetical protein